VPCPSGRFAEWELEGPWTRRAGAVGTRKNDDGSVSLITIDPGFVAVEFVIAERDRKRVLINRDGQHEYFFTETPRAPAPAQASATPSSSSSARSSER